MVSRLAAGLAFASAAVTLYWTLGGTALLATVGGRFEDLARERSSGALALGVVVVAAKVAAGWLAMTLRRRPRRLTATLATVGGVLLAVYGGALVAVGALVLGGAIDPSGRSTSTRCAGTCCCGISGFSSGVWRSLSRGCRRATAVASSGRLRRDGSLERVKP
jgi:hypothetical protein